MLDSCAGKANNPDAVLLIKGLLRAFGGVDRIVELSNPQPEAVQDRGVKEPEDSGVFLFCNEVAPMYGVLTSGAVQAMDEELKIAVAGTARALANLRPERRGWDDIMSVLAQSPVLEPCPGNAVDRADKLLVDRRNWRKRTQQHDAVVKEVQAWFTNLVVDPDILTARSAIDLSVVSKIVAHAGNTMDGFVIEKKHDEKTLVDIGILRYPDPENPFITVYRIKLFAWYESTMILGRAHDKNGISGQFNARAFKPRKAIISGMRGVAKKRAIAEANKLWESAAPTESRAEAANAQGRARNTRKAKPVNKKAELEAGGADERNAAPDAIPVVQLRLDIDDLRVRPGTRAQLDEQLELHRHWHKTRCGAKCPEAHRIPLKSHVPKVQDKLDALVRAIEFYLSVSANLDSDTCSNDSEED